MGFLDDIEFANESKLDPVVKNKITEISARIKQKGIKLGLSTIAIFEDSLFFYALPETIRNNDQSLADLLVNMSRFQEIIYSERNKRHDGDLSGLFGNEINLPESVHFNGRIRRAESGNRINIDYLKSIGIDPSKVLFFRVTQPPVNTTSQKPEYYWTSDYFEVCRGLQSEISPDQRENAIILVAGIDKINLNGGLIQDVNDDNGLAVRQIGQANFDQSTALTKIIPN